MKKFIALAAFALLVGGANAGSKGQAPVAQKAQAAQAPAQKAQAPAAKAQAPAKGQAAGKPQSAGKGQAATAPADCGCEKVGVLGGLRDRVGGLRERLRARLSGN